MQKYKLFGLAPPIWVAQYIYSIDIQRIIKCESKRCQSQENIKKYFLLPAQSRIRQHRNETRMPNTLNILVILLKKNGFTAYLISPLPIQIFEVAS